MSAVTLSNATRLALWLASEHPAAFRQIAWRIATQPARVRAGGLGALGDAGLDSLVIDPASLSLPAPDFSNSFDASPISNLTVDEITPTSELSQAFDPTTIAAQGTDAGFWSSLGSGISSVASGTANVIGSVARSLTSPGVLQSAGQIAASMIQADTQTKAANAQQQAILATQLARVQSGTSPATITYVTSPTGQRVPMVYNSATGQYQPVTQSQLSSLLPQGLPTWLPYALAGGIVLTLILASRN